MAAMRRHGVGSARARAAVPLTRHGLLVGLMVVLAGTVAGCALGSGDKPTESRRETDASPAPGASALEQSAAPPQDRATGWGPLTSEVERARALVAEMTVEDQVATVLMPGFWGYDGARPTEAEQAQNQVMHRLPSAVDVVRERGYAGFFLRPEVIADARQVGRLTAQLHEVGDAPDGLPLLLSIDQEGGTVQRLKVGVPPVPSAASVGERASTTYAEQVARRNGATLRELGLTMVFAPVADVDPDGTSAIGSRAYSRDPEVAADLVVATMRGYLDSGLVPVVKHFPGLGSVRGDSHRVLPVQQKELAALRRTDLLPFAAAVEAGAPVVMTGHVAVPALEPGMPASLSRAVIQTLLRGELGFEGVAVTDSQGMAPVHARFGPAEGAVRSLLAGNDLVLNSPRPERARRAVLDAVASGRLPLARLAEAATRVTALRIYQQRLAAEADTRR